MTEVSLSAKEKEFRAKLLCSGRKMSIMNANGEMKDGHHAGDAELIWEQPPYARILIRPWNDASHL